MSAATASAHPAASPTAPPAVPIVGAGVLRSTALFAGRSIRHSLRDAEALTMAVLLPVMLMVLFTYVFGGAIDRSGDYLSYVTPGIVLLCAGFGAASTAVAVSSDLTTGVINRVRTLPITSATVLAGHTAASLLRNLAATGVVIGVAVALGYRPQAGLLGWLAAIGLIVAWILAITALFAAIGLLASSPEAANGYGFMLLFLPYVSSAFVPVSTMPGWLQWFAAHQPVTPLIESLRALLEGGSPGGTALVALGWCLAILAAAAALAAWAFPRRVAR